MIEIKIETKIEAGPEREVVAENDLQENIKKATAVAVKNIAVIAAVKVQVRTVIAAVVVEAAIVIAIAKVKMKVKMKENHLKNLFPKNPLQKNLKNPRNLKRSVQAVVTTYLKKRNRNEKKRRQDSKRKESL